MWQDEWESVLELMHLKMKEWLLYLVRTRHMSNLWVEREGIEKIKPQHDSISRSDAEQQQTSTLDYSSDATYNWKYDTSNAFPQYFLSDFTSLWLALSYLEKLIQSMGRIIKSRNLKQQDPIRHRFKEV